MEQEAELYPLPPPPKDGPSRPQASIKITLRITTSKIGHIVELSTLAGGPPGEIVGMLGKGALNT